MPRKPVFDIGELREKVLSDIQREREEKLTGRTSAERQNVDSYFDFIEKHTSVFARQGSLWIVTENPYALVVGLRCPWRKCNTVYRVARFMSEREGRAFFLVCVGCRQRIITLRDTIVVFGTNSYPVKKIQAEMLANPAYATQCRKTPTVFLECYDAWMARPPVRDHQVLEETKDHRGISVRTTLESDEDTLMHLNEGFRKRKIKGDWGIG